MINSFFQTWFRNTLKHKSYFLINISGLSLGICAVMGIFLFVYDEISYEAFQLKKDRVFRVTNTSHFSGIENRYSTTSAPLADAIRSDIAEVEEAGRLFGRQAALQIVNDKDPGVADQKFREDNFFFGDPEMFRIFTFSFLKGSPETALQNPGQLLISERIAVKYFGSADAAIGKEVLFEGKLPLTVSSVIRDYPEQSHVKIELLTHFENFYHVEDSSTQAFLRRDWIYNPVATYVLLRENADGVSAGQKINALREKYGDERVAKGIEFGLQPLTQIHLYSDFSFENVPLRIRYVYLLASIGLLILVVACINFINLATVHSLKRAKEIGIRKVLGSDKKALILQFFGESTLTVLISFVVASVMMFVLLPSLNHLSAKQIEFNSIFEFRPIMGLLLIFICTIFFSGLYPSLYITRFKPILILKGLSGHQASEGFLVRRVLVVTQFTVSITLVVLSIVFYQQMTYVRNKPLGFQRDYMLTIPLFSENPNSILGGGVGRELRARMNAFEIEIARNPAVEAVSVSSALPGQGAVSALVVTDKIKSEENVFVALTAVDYDFLETYRMELIDGRNFSREFGTDHLQAFIVNEQTIKRLGWASPREAIGQSMELVGKKGSVVGVVKDFHFQGLQHQIQPLILEVAAGKFTVFSMHLNQNVPLKEAIAGIKSEWDKAFPEKVFEYQFLDDRLDQGYDHENRLVNLMEIFALLTIFISGLGLFGLAAYINYQRSKEVSIRKVLGATVAQIFYVLTREFLLMIAIAFAVAVPLSLFLSTAWLDTFAFRVDVGLLPFVGAAFIATLIVWITISYETLKTSRINPVERLRNE